MLDQENTIEIESTSQQSVPETELQNQSGEGESKEVAAQEKPKHDAPVPKSRFNEVYREKQELKREKEQLLQLLAQARPAAQAPAQAQVESPPDITQYTDQGEYLRDLAEFSGRQAARTEFKQLKEAEKAKSEKEAEQNRFVSAVEKFNKIPGLTEALEATAHIQYPADHQLLVMGSDYAKELVLHLAANLEDAEAISKMSVPQAALAIGRIEGTIKASAGNTTPAPKVSKMVPPVSPVAATKHQSNARTSDETIEEMTRRLFPIG